MRIRNFLLVMIVFALTADLSAGTVANTGGMSLAAVSASRLKEMDITLQSPAALARPTLSRSRAEGIALAVGPPGTTVRETMLVRLVDTGDVPAVNCLCWAVSVAPHGESHGPPGARPVTFTFEIRFIDAETGAFIEGARGN